MTSLKVSCLLDFQPRCISPFELQSRRGTGLVNGRDDLTERLRGRLIIQSGATFHWGVVWSPGKAQWKWWVRNQIPQRPESVLMRQGSYPMMLCCSLQVQLINWFVCWVACQAWWNSSAFIRPVGNGEYLERVVFKKWRVNGNILTSFPFDRVMVGEFTESFMLWHHFKDPSVWLTPGSEISHMLQVEWNWTSLNQTSSGLETVI